MYQDVASSQQAPNHVTSSNASGQLTSEQRPESTSPVAPARTKRPPDGSIIPMSDAGLIDSSEESDSGNDVEKTLSRWLDYRDCAVVPISQQHTPTSLRRDSVGETGEGNTTGTSQLTDPREDSEASFSDETNVHRPEAFSFESLEGAIVPLAEAADDGLEAECSASTQVGNAPVVSPLEGAVVPLAQAPDEEGDEAEEGGATVRRVSVASESRTVSKRDSSTEVDGDYSKDIAGIVELLVYYIIFTLTAVANSTFAFSIVNQ